MKSPFLFFILLAVVVLVNSEFAIRRILDNTDITEFASLLVSSRMIEMFLHFDNVTIFAPTNSAFQNLQARPENIDELLAYHVVFGARTSFQLLTGPINSSLPGGLPLYVTKISEEKIFINNAEMIMSTSNDGFFNEDGKYHIVHVIDEVLIPIKMPLLDNNQSYSPTALDFLQNFQYLGIEPFSIYKFARKVLMNRQYKLFSAHGYHTFFMPVDSSYTQLYDLLLNRDIIKSHIIADRTLFIPPTNDVISYPTTANKFGELHVEISLSEKVTHGRSYRTYLAKSYTSLGNGKYFQGTVLSEIVKANIPLKNGVLHLISKPFVIVDETVRSTLFGKLNSMDISSEFVRKIKEAAMEYDNIFNILEKERDITLLIPNDEAWRKMYVVDYMAFITAERFREIMYMHLVVGSRLFIHKVMDRSDIYHYNVKTRNPGTAISFSYQPSYNPTFSIQAGSVNATIIHSDIACKNGIIHVIDRVLGIPYASVYEKLRTDPKMNESFVLGFLTGFNQHLTIHDRKYTFFVPSNKAWVDYGEEYPYVVRKLNQSYYLPYTKSILERHLIIADTFFPLEFLAIKGVQNQFFNSYIQMTEIQTVNGLLSISVEQLRDGSFIIFWNGLRIPVLKANVECTDGIMHIIDLPFIRKDDIL